MPVHTVKGYYRKDGTYVKTFSRVFSSIYRRRNKKFDQAYIRYLAGDSRASIGKDMGISGIAVGRAFHRRGFAKPENWLSVKDQRDLMCAKLQSDLIKNLVCIYYKIPIQEFDKSVSKGSQEHQFIKIRHIIAYMIDRHTDIKHPYIAKTLSKGGFYVASAIKKTKGSLSEDSNLKEEARELDRLIYYELAIQTKDLVSYVLDLWTSVLKGGKVSFLEAWKKTDIYNIDYENNN